jgi:hypothetical protein
MGNNNLQEVKQQTMLQTTNAWVKKLSAFADASKIEFDKYQQEIVVNTVRKIAETGMDIYDFETNNVADVLYQTAFLRLNPSAIPRHCYFMSRDVWENGKKVGKKLEIGIEGEGNDEILRTAGVGIRRDANGEAVGVHKVWIVREFDDFQDGYYSGLEFVHPTWKPKPTPIGQKKGRVIKVVYPIERTSGEVEYWSAERADLQPIILKHIEQNLKSYSKADKNGYEKLMRTLKDLSFDEIINEFGDEKIEYKAWGKDISQQIISDSYTGSTGDAMIVRKLRNVAIRTFPKNFDKTVVAKIYENTFEEKYDKPTIQEKAQDKIEHEVQEKAGQTVIEEEQKDTIPEVSLETEPRVVKQNKSVTEKNSVVEPKKEIVEEEKEDLKFDIDEIDEDMFK